MMGEFIQQRIMFAGDFVKGILDHLEILGVRVPNKDNSVPLITKFLLQDEDFNAPRLPRPDQGPPQSAQVTGFFIFIQLSRLLDFNLSTPRSRAQSSNESSIVINDTVHNDKTKVNWCAKRCSIFKSFVCLPIKFDQVFYLPPSILLNKNHSICYYFCTPMFTPK
jgi:hypothetical protein